MTAGVMTRGRRDWGGREKPKLQGRERFNAIADSADEKKKKKSQDDIPGFPGNIARNACNLITVNRDQQKAYREQIMLLDLEVMLPLL